METFLKEREEINFKVDDYELAFKFLEALGFYVRHHRENLREEWKFEGCKVEIDTYPYIPTFIEIEGPNENAVLDLALSLDFSRNHLHALSISQVLRHYNLPDEGPRSIAHLVFNE